MGWTVADMPDLRGRVAVVTGANGGLGFETAVALARRGAHVVMTTRSRDCGEATRGRIVAGHPSASLELATMDTADLASVRRAAAQILDRHRTLDILVNNAGVMAIPFGRSVDGHELQLATNHLGHFALTGLLAPALFRGNASRIVSITSTGRFLGRPPRANDTLAPPRYGSWAA
jgi:NAD(P)-dependent dehydrogenase (short-subunit alcohol dehydrogenase family)